jgi:hypothetical protein
MNKGKYNLEDKINLTLFCFEVKSENSNSRSSSFDNSGDECHVQRRKTARVRSLIQSSIKRFSTDEQIKGNKANRDSTSISIHKRPFPFGHW